MKTKRLPVKYKNLVEGKYPNAGPCPSITGMKKQVYGVDSFCVTCGSFLYYLGKTLNGETSRIYRRLAK